MSRRQRAMRTRKSGAVGHARALLFKNNSQLAAAAALDVSCSRPTSSIACSHLRIPTDRTTAFGNSIGMKRGGRKPTPRRDRTSVPEWRRLAGTQERSAHAVPCCGNWLRSLDAALRDFEISRSRRQRRARGRCRSSTHRGRKPLSQNDVSTSSLPQCPACRLGFSRHWPTRARPKHRVPSAFPRAGILDVSHKSSAWRYRRLSRAVADDGYGFAANTVFPRAHILVAAVESMALTSTSRFRSRKTITRSSTAASIAIRSKSVLTETRLLRSEGASFLCDWC